MKWKLTIQHGYSDATFIFDEMNVCENFLRTFMRHKQPDEPVEEAWREKPWAYVIEPVTDDGVEDDIPVQ